MSSVARDGWVGRRREQSRPRRRHMHAEHSPRSGGWAPGVGGLPLGTLGHITWLLYQSINVNDVVHFWLADSPVAFGRAKQTVPGIDIRASCL